MSLRLAAAAAAAAAAAYLLARSLGRARPLPVACLGDLFIDVHLHAVAALPSWGADVSCSSVSLLPGGSCANTARHLARLAHPRAVHLFSAVGDDALGALLLRQLLAEGHLASPRRTIARLRGVPQSACVVLSGGADRAMVSCYTSTAATQPPAAALAARRWALLHIGGYFSCPALHTAALTALCTRLAAEGTLLSLDLQHDASGEWVGRAAHLHALLPLVDVFLPSEAEASAVAAALGAPRAQPALDALCARLPSALVVVKRAADGAVAGLGARRWEQKAAAVAAVDPTGCGDAFDAAFLAALLAAGAARGALEPHVAAALRAGCAAGACCARTAGACVVPLRAEEISAMERQL